MTIKKQTIDQIIALEGGYSNEAADSGGETMYGITKQVARDYGYHGPMNQLPRELAFDIYAELYWDTVKGDVLSKLSEAVAEEIVDTGVNMGVGRAAEFLQRCLNVFNKSGYLYSDIKIDGDIGPATLGALAKYLTTRNEMVLVKALNCLQGSFYVELAERREKDEAHLYGWISARVKL